jgi:hypothetical protein
MFSLRRILRGPDASVRSLAVQANEPVEVRQNNVFEVLTRHLLYRLVHNEALGEEIPTRMTQVAYMLALPGVLIALYLFAPYHQPKAIGPRPFWHQISDHYVYTVYAFVVMGIVTVFEWELLFPDLLDVFVLTTLPISKRKLLAARLMALAIFLVLALVGTNFLGALFFPAVADLHGMWWRHVASHVAAVAMAGIFAAALFVALQGGLLCLVGRRLFGWVSPLVQALSMVALLTILFLTPLISSNLPPLLNSGNVAVWLFPPFWFLGLYEFLLWGSAALPVSLPLAEIALMSTAGTLILAVITYPLAYTRRVRQLVEGSTLIHRRSMVANMCRRLLHLTVLRSPQKRAVYHFISQMMLRIPRLRLYLTIYVGVGLSLAISGLLLLDIHEGHIHFHCSEWGIRSALPVLTFLIVIGMRTAMDAPVGLQGSWIFLVIHGRPLPEHLRAVCLWVTVSVSAVMVTSAALLHLLVPLSMSGTLSVATQLIMAIGLPILLARAFLLRISEIPFTMTRMPTTRDLPISFVRYSVIFPAFVFFVIEHESWIETDIVNLLKAVLWFASIYIFLGYLRKLYLKKRETDSGSPDAVLIHRLGLQE